MKQTQATGDSPTRRDRKISAQAVSHPVTIVHLGAGACSELDDYLTHRPEHIILVEANPDEAHRLVRRVASTPEVEVIPVAIAPTGGIAKLKIFNIAAFSSLRTPTGLHRLFPGLRLQGETEVEAITPVNLIERLEIDPSAGNWLVIDVPGEEATTIDSLRKAGLLGLFERIVLQCGRSALYDGASEADALTALLQDEGYDISASNEGPDPDFLCWTLQRNPFRIENSDLRTQMKALEQQLQEKIKQIAGTEQQLEQLSRQHAEQEMLASERQARVEQLTHNWTELAALAEERLRKFHEISQERNEMAGQLAEHQARFEYTDKALAEKSRLAAEYQNQIKQLTKIRDEQIKLASEQQARIKQLESNVSDLESREQLLMEEMARAEGQINMIKDVLLREPDQI